MCVCVFNAFFLVQFVCVEVVFLSYFLISCCKFVSTSAFDSVKRLMSEMNNYRRRYFCLLADKALKSLQIDGLMVNVHVSVSK